MGKRKGGYRKKTRSKLKKHYKKKGRISLKSYLQAFEPSTKVILKPEPAFHKGMPHQRYFGRHGRIIKKQGRCYQVEIRDGNSCKLLVIHPVHLKPVEVGKEEAKRMLLAGV